MVYDPVGQFVLLFGGLAHWGAVDYTWAGFGLKNSPTPGFFWVNLTGVISVAPSPRYYASMTYDPALHGVLLFGGMYSGGPTTLADTWLFTGNAGDPQWTLLPVGAHPSPRGGAALTYDPLDNYAVLFGGYDDPDYYSDTWTFSGGTWNELRVADVPFERAFAGFVYNNATGSCLLTMGGGGAVDTWSFVHGIWTELAPGTPLGGRISPSVVYDYQSNNLTLFGGQSPSLTSAFGDTWNDSPTQVWSELPTSGPSPRSAAAMAFDPLIGFTVLFGGGSVPSGLQNDTWLFGTWPLSSAPFSVNIVANPAPALHPLIQPGENATVTVFPAGGTWPYHVAVSLLGPNGPHPPNYVISGSSNGAYTVSMRFPEAASYEILANVTAGGSGQTGSANLTYPVGTVVLPNWQPIRDGYTFHNFGSSWAPGGNCWGFSTTTILYWEHDIQGLVGTPELPSPAWATSALRIPPPKGNPGMNATTLAIIAHQAMDPANNVADGGGFGAGQMAANYAKLLASLDAGEPSLLSLSAPNVGYHAVVAYGEFTDPLNGLVYILTTDPNDPLGTNIGVYNPTAETFTMVSAGHTINAFEVPNSPLPSNLQPDWTGPGSWGNSNWYENDSSFGDYYVLASVPVNITSSRGGVDYFSDWYGAESQSFVEGIPDSAGIEEPHTYVVNGNPEAGSVQLFGIVATAHTQYSIADPSAESYPLQVLRAINESGSTVVQGFDLNVSSNGTHHVSIVPDPNGTEVRVGSEAIRMNVTFGQLIGVHVDSLNASMLPLPSDSLVTFTVRNWSALGSQIHPMVLVRVTADNGSGPSYQYGLENGQTGLGPATSLDYAVSFQEVGIPSGQSWTVALNGSTESTTGTSLGFSLPNGTYSCLILGSRDRVASTGCLSGSGGTLAVSGPAVVDVDFLTGRTTEVTFVETGLIPTTSWCMAFGRSPELPNLALRACSTHASLRIDNVPGGSESDYAYAPIEIPGYAVAAGTPAHPIPLPGLLSSLTKAARVPIRFSAVLYSVTFVQSGLPTTMSWAVKAQCMNPKAEKTGCYGMTERGHVKGTQIGLMLRNGTYDWQISSIQGYQLEVHGVVGWGGSLAVDGTSISLAAVFVRT